MTQKLEVRFGGDGRRGVIVSRSYFNTGEINCVEVTDVVKTFHAC